MILSSNNVNILTSVSVLPKVQCDDCSKFLIQKAVHCKGALFVCYITKLSKQALALLNNCKCIYFSFILQKHNLTYIGT